MKQSEARSLIEAKVTIDDKGCWLWPGESEQYSTVTINGKYYGAPTDCPGWPTADG
jgi:hypothetical protein